MLPYTLANDSRFAVMHCETLLQQNSRDVQPEAFRAPRKLLTPGKCKIVGVPRVSRARGLCQSAQPAIHPITTDVGQQWRCGRALWQMGTGIDPANLAYSHRPEMSRNLIPDVSRRSGCANAPEQISYSFGISQRSKEALNPSARKRREEIPQVHSQYNSLSHMRRDECLNRPPLHESMHSGMLRDLLQNPQQNLPLQIFQPLLGRLNQSNAAEPLG